MVIGVATDFPNAFVQLDQAATNTAEAKGKRKISLPQTPFQAYNSKEYSLYFRMHRYKEIEIIDNNE